MTTRHSVEDLESGADGQIEAEYQEDAELERIKGNYRATVIVPELPANYPETQEAFQELQNELQDFLGQYISKVTSLQAVVSSNITNGVAHDNRIASRMSRMTRASMLIQNHDVDDGELKASDSQTSHDTTVPSRHSSMNHRKDPVNKHMQNLQAFLIGHMENLAALQTATSTGTGMHAKRSNGKQLRAEFVPTAVPTSIPTSVSNETTVPSAGPPAYEADKRVEDGLSQQCHAVVVISTATAIFISALLTLSQFILGPNKQRVAYDVGMMFALLSLSFHFGIILLGGRGARRVARHSLGDKSKEDFKIYINFYLTICEQMQLLATLLLVIATVILSFLIFSSLAFPAVILILSAIWAIVVSVSAYYKVLITVENMVFLAKNLPRLGWRSLDYVKTNVKARPATTHPVQF